MEIVDYKNLYPGIRSSLSNGWNKMLKYFLPLFLVSVILMLVDGPAKIGQNSSSWHIPFFLLFFLIITGTAYWFLLRPVFKYGADYIFIQAIRDKDVEVRDIVKGFDNYWNVVLAHLLASMLIGLSFVALIIPGIIVACRLAFVSYLVMDKQMDAIEAVETSWRLTKGHGWRIFGLAILAIFICIAGLIMMIVGIFPASIWVKASFATLYQATLNEKENMFEYENQVIEQ